LNYNEKQAGFAGCFLFAHKDQKTVRFLDQIGYGYTEGNNACCLRLKYYYNSHERNKIKILLRL